MSRISTAYIIFYILYLCFWCLIVIVCLCIFQGAGGADLSVWGAYGRAEGAGGSDATGGANLWGSSLSTSPPHTFTSPLWEGRNPGSSTGTGWKFSPFLIFQKPNNETLNQTTGCSFTENTLLLRSDRMSMQPHQILYNVVSSPSRAHLCLYCFILERRQCWRWAQQLKRVMTPILSTSNLWLANRDVMNKTLLS